MYLFLLLAFSSFFLAFVLTPLCRNFFRRWGWLDHPISKENCIVSRFPEREVFRSWWRMSERLQWLWYLLGSH